MTPQQLYNQIKVGDLVETCSLMPGVVMKREGDDIEVRMLDVDEYKGDSYACCSLSHCGIVKITAIQALNRLRVGKDVLSNFYMAAGSVEEYEKLINDYLKDKN